ncbi:MAG: hypothetical protein AMXMBFR23_07610 [Chloroflexota bacterium]
MNIASRPPALFLPLVALLGLLAAACEGATPSAPTGDVFAGAPWTGPERLEYDLHSGTGELIGHAILTTTVEGDRLVLGQQYVEASAPDGQTPATDTARVVVDAATLRPVEGSREVMRRTESGSLQPESYTWTYGLDDEGNVTMTSVRTIGEETRERTLRIRDHYYDNESSLWLWRALAFEEGFNQNYVSANPVEQSQQTVNLQVPQRETITVPAGEFEAWRLIFRNGRAVRTAWVNAEAPHQVLRWDNSDIVFELTNIGE